MPTQKCLDNIKSEDPPYNVSCTPDFCYKTSFARDVHCSKRGLPVDTPVLTWDPNLNGGQACYCCCSCFALDTPIEVKKGLYTLIQDIQSGDLIIACGVDLIWKPHKVKYRTGDIDKSNIPNMYYVEYLMPGEKANRNLLVTADHLFLMNGTKHLKKVQFLVPGDKLTTADGAVAVVQFVTHGTHYTAIQTIEMSGRINPRTLDGHLINSNGVVTADYAVQVHYELGDQRNALHASPDEVEDMAVGSDAYEAKHGNAQSRAFAQTPASWPKGFIPDQSTEMQVPNYSTGYISSEQAKSVRKNGKFNPNNNTTGRANILYLFQQSQKMYPDIVCILDWNNRTPNAYAWEASGQKYIVFCGGLIRLKGLYLDGLSLILGSLQASLQAQACVCEWDYAATSSILRTAWPDSILAKLVPAGIAQVQDYFKAARDAPPPDGMDPCDAPTLDCRIQSYWAGFSFDNLPDCAGVFPRYLMIGTAYATMDNLTVSIVFNDQLDPATATDIANYAFSPTATITAAALSPGDARQVDISVSDLAADSYYVLLLQNLQSVHGAPLGPDQNKAIIATHVV